MQMSHGSSMRMRSFAMWLYDARATTAKGACQCMWKLHSIMSCTSSCDERVGTPATRSDLRKDRRRGAKQRQRRRGEAAHGQKAYSKSFWTSCPMAFFLSVNKVKSKNSQNCEN